MTKQEIQESIDNLEGSYVGGFQQEEIKSILTDLNNSSEGSYTEVEKYELDALITTSGLVPGMLYKINGVHPELFNDDSQKIYPLRETGVTIGQTVITNTGATGTAILLGTSHLMDYAVISKLQGDWDNSTTISVTTPGGTILHTIDASLFSTIGGTTIFLRALTPTQLATEGYGIFYNPKYSDTFVPGEQLTLLAKGKFTVISGEFDTAGGFSLEKFTGSEGQVGRFVEDELHHFQIISGDWFTNPSITITGQESGAVATLTNIVGSKIEPGDKVFFNGFSYISLTGELGLSSQQIENITLSLPETDWQKEPYSTVSRYAMVIDKISYNYTIDKILSREDNLGNIVKYDTVFLQKGPKGSVGIFAIFGGGGGSPHEPDDETAQQMLQLFGNPIATFKWGSKNYRANTIINSIFLTAFFSGSEIFKNNFVSESILLSSSSEKITEIVNNRFFECMLYSCYFLDVSGSNTDDRIRFMNNELNASYLLLSSIKLAVSYCRFSGLIMMAISIVNFSVVKATGAFMINKFDTVSNAEFTVLAQINPSIDLFAATYLNDNEIVNKKIYSVNSGPEPRVRISFINENDVLVVANINE